MLRVGGHARMPLGEHPAQRSIECSCSRLQEKVSALLRPLHLLFLDEVLADNNVDRGFNEGRGDPLTIAPAFAVVRNRMGVVGDVSLELIGRWLRIASWTDSCFPEN